MQIDGLKLIWPGVSFIKTRFPGLDDTNSNPNKIRLKGMNI